MTVDKPDEPHGLNDLNVAGIRYLLVGMSSSHLAGLAEGDVRGRHALAEWRTGTERWAPSYDLEALLDRIWSPHTLCGREWIEMEPGDGPRSTVQVPAYTRQAAGTVFASSRTALRVWLQTDESLLLPALWLRRFLPRPGR